ncbi:MAG TPA: hypothetical protein VIW24_05735 [Aldersonia sp.]
MEITLDVFSGRPNPTWSLSDAQARELIDRAAGRALAAPDSGPDLLGFRGYIVSAVSDDGAEHAGLPASFRLDAVPAERLVAPEGLAARALTVDESVDASSWLLSTAGAAVEDDVLEYVREAIGERRAAYEAPAEGLDEGPSPEAEEEAPEGVARAACILANTAYNPAFWNVPSVQPHNNCYNYAMNYRSNTFAQPGRISGHPNNVMQCPNVATASNWDGCTAYCSGSNKNVALVVWPNNDYHWYRYHSNGFWGHKPGGTAARNTDNSGQVIGGGLNPYNCNRGPYTLFCGYRYSPTGMQVS